MSKIPDTLFIIYLIDLIFHNWWYDIGQSVAEKTKRANQNGQSKNTKNHHDEHQKKNNNKTKQTWGDNE
jgi:hypothetical protein